MKNKCRKLIFLLFSSSRVDLFVKKQNWRNLSLIVLANNSRFTWNTEKRNATLSDFTSTAMALNPRQKSSSTFNIQVFILNVMFTIEIWSFRNKTLSLHSRSYPVVINPSSKLPPKIHDWSILCQQSTITSTTKSLLRQSSLRFNIRVSFEQAAFLSTLNSLLQRSVFALSLFEGCAQTTYNFWIQSSSFGLNFTLD